MIYLDNNATSRVDPDVADVIYKALKENWGNPSTVYAFGNESKYIYCNAVSEVWKYFGSYSSGGMDVVFTGSGSEANNLALTGFYNKAIADGKKCAVFCTEIEHSSIINQPCVQAKIPVDDRGFVDTDALRCLLDVSTKIYDVVLISVQMANNEIGTIQDIKKIADLIHTYKECFLHSDVTQCLYLCRDLLNTANIDIITASLHKSGMPKGIGFMYSHFDWASQYSFLPIVYGGHQQHGLHAGTENIPYIAAVPTCLNKLVLNSGIKTKRDYLKAKRNYLWEKIHDKIDNVIVNGDLDSRLDNNLSVSFLNIDGESLLHALDTDDICVSVGSACNSESIEASHVLRAIGVPDGYIYGTIRFSLGADTTYADLDFVVQCLERHVKTLRQMSEEKAGV